MPEINYIHYEFKVTISALLYGEKKKKKKLPLRGTFISMNTI